MASIGGGGAYRSAQKCRYNMKAWLSFVQLLAHSLLAERKARAD